jgi:hypothetical protein
MSSFLFIIKQQWTIEENPPFKMAAVTKNRNFFSCPLLLYYLSK